MSGIVRVWPLSVSKSLSSIALLFLFAIQFATAATEGIRSIDLPLKSLVYDPFTEKLYGSATNDLLQIDPETGAVLKNFRLGTNVTLLSLGAGNGLWVVIGDHAVRRFNLETLTAEDAIPIVSGSPVNGLYASREDSTSAAGITATLPGSYGQLFVIRNGVVLPGSPNLAGGDAVALKGNIAYWSGAGTLYRYSVGPNGLTGAMLGGGGSGTFLFVPPYLYRASGHVYDANSLALPLVKSLPYSGAVAVDEPQSSVYYLQYLSTNSSLLTRFAHPSLQLTGAAELPGIVILGGEYLVAYSSKVDPFTKLANRLAFNSGGKLILLDTDKLFVPANLEVIQTVSGKGVFGAPVTFDVTITNKGPGSAIQVKATNSFSSGAAYLNSKPSAVYRDPIPLQWDIITPGSTATFSVTVQPGQLGVLTNTVYATAANAPSPTTNAAVRPINAQTGPITLLNFSPSKLTFDPTLNRLFFLENYRVWSVDPDALLLNGPGAFVDETLDTVSVLESSQGALVGFGGGKSSFNGGELFRIDPQTLTISNWFIGPFRQPNDLKISPVDTNLVFLSDERGSAIYRNGLNFPNYITYQTHGFFSPDGTKLYAVNPANCELEIFSLTGAGLILQGTQVTGSCADFKQTGGLLYNDSGMIYDPVAGHKTTNSVTLPAGSSVVLRDDGTLDIVTKTNGVWIARRVASGTHQELRRVYLDDVPGLPGEATAAGDHRIALRTAVGGIYLIDFGSGSLYGRISLTNQTATISFDTNPGHTYRLERTDRLGGTWTPVGSNFVADAGTHDLTVPIDQASTAFFRMVQVQ
jgi:hypothetical protein